MDKEHYLRARQHMVQTENEQRTGGKLILTDKELKVNEKLLSLKKEEINHYRNENDGQNFPPAVNFLKAKGSVESSKVYDIIRAMPKGEIFLYRLPGLADL